MVSTSPLRILRKLRHRQVRVSHPDAVGDAHLNLPRRIDDPVSAATVARDLLRNRREDISLVLYLDERHRFIGHAIVAIGRVQAARLSALPILQGSAACRAGACILVRYRPWGLLAATAGEQRSYRLITGACGRQRLRVVDHLVVVGSGGHTSASQHMP